MAQKHFQFKTNINCGGCLATVKPHLDQVKGINHWEVNTTDKDKILTVQSDGISEEQVMATVRDAGFKIESLNK